jgi:tellurite methyltransferase
LKLPDWDDRYRSRDEPGAPNPLVIETARHRPRGRALDLACGTGRNALWLASNGWSVTAVDGSVAAIQKLQLHAGALPVETHIADLEKGEFAIAESSWDLILVCYYLQRDLFEPLKRGVAPGGTVIAIVHITEGRELPTQHRMRPGELAHYFEGWEILHSHEGASRDPAHRRASAEIVARRLIVGQAFQPVADFQSARL